MSREIALAVTVGQFSGKLAQALGRLPDRRFALQWLEMMPRLAYPLLVFCAMLGILHFVVLFIIPKFERIFLDFKMRLPVETEVLISASRWGFRFWPWTLAGTLFLIVAINLLIASSRVRWHTPFIGMIYRQYARGQFLHVLGLMLGRVPFPDFGLHCRIDFYRAVSDRAHRLMRLRIKASRCRTSRVAAWPRRRAG